MERPDWAPQSIDLDQASAARIYDYFLGGLHNFAADREAARSLLAVTPDAALLAQANRAFLRRSVRFLCAAGIRQFIDVGSGIPTVGNVHEIAQQTTPGSRVVYVDVDPVAVAHSAEILAGNTTATIIREDVRNPERITGHPEVQRLIDFTEPVALLLVSLLHFLPDEAHPADLVRRLSAPLTTGSYLAISHATRDSRRADADDAEAVYQRTNNPIRSRPRHTVLSYFDGFQLVEPGLVWAPQWRPDSPYDVGDDPDRFSIYTGVGRKE